MILTRRFLATYQKAIPLKASGFLITALVLACVLLVPLQRASAQAVPSAEQLELLRNLSPEQRDALLRQITGGGGGSSAPREQREERADREASREQDLRRFMQREEQEDPRLRPLKGEDWVLIDIGFPGTLPPAPNAANAANATNANAGFDPRFDARPGTLPPGTNPMDARAPAGRDSSDPRAQRQQPEDELSAEERKRLEGVIDLVRSRNPYQLARDGVLQLPGFAGIALAGLMPEEATLRLQAEPALRRLEIRLTRLPLTKTGAEALKPFGYDLFDQAPSTFAPVTNVPVPSDYVVGPGDELDIQLYGNQNRSLRLTVGRDGRINFPELGPISVGGQRFNSVKQSIEARVERQMIGVRASVSMGDTRSIRVFVMGEARRPGSYTISGLGTVTSALYAAGGVQRIGSLRNIQLKRQGAVVRRLDLYDLLLRGDTADDAKLLPGDVIFIPPVGPTVSVDGEVHRPAIYEIKGETSVAELVQLAGGLTSEADTSKATLTRIDSNGRRLVVEVNPRAASGNAYTMRGGDLLRVARLKPTLDSGVVVQGHAYTTGPMAYREGLRLSDVIRSVDELRPNADIHYVLIRRELPPDRRVAVLSADLAAALKAPSSEADVPLMPRDRITVFDLESGRDRVIQPLLDELRLQATLTHPTELVRVDGRVRVPGEYPLEPGMTVSDLVRAGGSLSDAAYGGKAELTRYSVVNGETRKTDLIAIDLAAALRGDSNADVVLQPFDSLSIKEVSEWGKQEVVMLEGEVRFPGRYAIKRGETLKSVLTRAGGLSPYAFPEGSVFTREDLKEREQQQLDILASRLQNDLATLALRGAAANQTGAATALSVGQSLLSQVRAAEAVGRLVIDLPRNLRADSGSAADVVLQDGDRLIIPRYQQEVTVIGEVQNATSHFFRPELARDDYIGLSGGITRKADRGKIYVVRADGSVIASESNRWFRRSADVKVRPGDTVVVPMDTEKLPALPFWQAVTQILYNLAISAAAVNSF